MLNRAVARVAAAARRAIVWARARPMYRPSCPPIEAIRASRSASGWRMSVEKNSMAPTVWSPTVIGKANAVCRPMPAVLRTRLERAMAATSETQIGSPSAQARPGMPAPRANRARRHSRVNARASISSVLQISEQRSSSVAGSTSQTAPSSHSRNVPSRASTRGAASRRLDAAASVLVASS